MSTTKSGTSSRCWAEEDEGVAAHILGLPVHLAELEMDTTYWELAIRSESANQAWLIVKWERKESELSGLLVVAQQAIHQYNTIFGHVDYKYFEMSKELLDAFSTMSRGMAGGL